MIVYATVHLEVGVLPVCFFLGHFGKNVQCIYRCVHQKMGKHWKLKSVIGPQSEVHDDQQLEAHESDETVSGQQVYYYM